MTNQVPGYTSSVTSRFNAAGQIIGITTNDDSYSYEYKKNRVVVRSGGKDVFNIALENGRAVRIELIKSDWVQNISYDQDGRIKQIFLGEPDDASNTYTFNYRNGNLDYIIEEMKANKLIERRYTYEYSDVKVDSRTQALQSYFGLGSSNSLPVTLRGTSSTYLPSKLIYTERMSASPYTLLLTSFAEYSYIRSSDGKLTGVNIKDILVSNQGERITNQKINIESSCD
ncbi:MAG: hypothetical protein H7223_10950 [Pedobacter sp.]|nr:hypothetical protein [Pedobacter sp.]